MNKNGWMDLSIKAMPVRNNMVIRGSKLKIAIRRDLTTARWDERISARRGLFAAPANIHRPKHMPDRESPKTRRRLANQANLLIYFSALQESHQADCPSSVHPYERARMPSMNPFWKYMYLIFSNSPEDSIRVQKPYARILCRKYINY
jgi:hypothetical protein